MPCHDAVLVQQSPEHDMYWRPGQTLPTSEHHSTTHHHFDIYSILQNIQGSIERNFYDTKFNLADLQGRVTETEEIYSQLEVQNCSSSS